MVEKMPSAKTKHSQNDLGGQYKLSHKSLYFVPGGGTWVFFGRVCAAWDSKLAPRSRKNFP